MYEVVGDVGVFTKIFIYKWINQGMLTCRMSSLGINLKISLPFFRFLNYNYCYVWQIFDNFKINWTHKTNVKKKANLNIYGKREQDNRSYYWAFQVPHKNMNCCRGQRVDKKKKRDSKKICVLVFKNETARKL